MKRKAGKIRFVDLRASIGVEAIHGREVAHAFVRHTHRTLCIGTVECGRRTMLVRGFERTFVPGELFLIPPGEPHACISGDEPHDYRLLLIEPRLLEGASLEGLKPVLADSGLCRRFIELHEELLALSEPDFDQEGEVAGLVGEIVVRAADDEAFREKESDYMEAVALVCEYIEAHAAEKLTLEQLARMAALSPWHFLRVFSRCAGLPPHVYQQQSRVRAAKRLLSSGASLADTAAQTGFSDQSHFSHVFKRWVGVTPGDYLEGAGGVPVER